jgi:hypothetical protein
MLPLEQDAYGFFIVAGDFNGDGRLDALARRSATQWDLFTSCSGEGWFEAKPAFTFEMPGEGDLRILDLNGDGLSDLVHLPYEQASALVYTSQARQNKRRQP